MCSIVLTIDFTMLLNYFPHWLSSTTTSLSASTVRKRTSHLEFMDDVIADAVVTTTFRRKHDGNLRKEHSSSFDCNTFTSCRGTILVVFVREVSPITFLSHKQTPTWHSHAHTRTHTHAHTQAQTHKRLNPPFYQFLYASTLLVGEGATKFKLFTFFWKMSKIFATDCKGNPPKQKPCNNTQ